MIYYAQREDGPIKIGYGQNPDRIRDRIRRFQTASPEQVVLLGAHPGGTSLERELHERFAALHISGEWFQAGPDLVAHIEAEVHPMDAAGSDDDSLIHLGMQLRRGLISDIDAARGAIPRQAWIAQACEDALARA
jgi:hypothetical protein